MLENIKNILWGTPSALIILIFGAYFTFSLIKRGAFSKKNIKKAIRDYQSSGGGGISPLSSMATALGGTVGIGSITGVGIALKEGGAGSVFWFWLCGFLCVGIKYAEVVSASSSRERKGDVLIGGAMYSLKKNGHKIMAFIFAQAGLLASFGTGNMTQASAVGEIMASSGIPKILTGVFLALLVAFAVFGGQKRISNLSVMLVPIAGAIYLAACFFILLRGANNLPSVFSKIFSSAFGRKQVAGGVMGAGISTAISVGMTRCIFSNEAGMGTSPMAHASAENVSASSQGMMGGAEIIADSFVFSTVTALALLCFDTNDVYELFTSQCGELGRALLPVLLVIFAYSAIIAWCYYAESCITYLFPKAVSIPLSVYRIITVGFTFLGVMAASESVWDIADILNAFMMMPNLFDIFTKRKEIIKCNGTK